MLKVCGRSYMYNISHALLDLKFIAASKNVRSKSLKILAILILRPPTTSILRNHKLQIPHSKGWIFFKISTVIISKLNQKRFPHTKILWKTIINIIDLRVFNKRRLFFFLVKTEANFELEFCIIFFFLLKLHLYNSALDVNRTSVNAISEHL